MIRALKSFTIIAVLAFAGMGMYYAGKKALSLFDPAEKSTPVKVAKKIAPAKLVRVDEPEDMLKVQRAKEASQPFTFYEILNDKSMDKFVGLDGKVHTVIYPSSSAETSEETHSGSDESPDSVNDDSVAEEPMMALEALEAALTKLVSSTETPKTAEPAQETVSEPAAKVIVAEKKSPDPLHSLKLLQPISSSPTVQLARLNATPGAKGLNTVVGQKKEGYSLQVSSLKDSSKAQELVGKLQKKGYNAYFKTAVVPTGGVWNRVYIGPFAQLDQAKTFRTHYAKAEGTSPLLVKLP
jgi:cell division septation protein DedD